MNDTNHHIMTQETAVKIIQRFYRYYIKYSQEEIMDGVKWPIDPILHEPFDPQYIVRIFQPLGKILLGARHKVQIFNIQSLGKYLFVSENCENPLTGIKFQYSEIIKITNAAMINEILTLAETREIIERYYPNEPIRECIQNILNDKPLDAIQFITANNIYRGHINHYFLLNSFLNTELLYSISSEIESINLIMAITCYAPENIESARLCGADIESIDGKTRIGVSHILAKMGRWDVYIRFIEELDLLEESNIGSPLDIANAAGINLFV